MKCDSNLDSVTGRSYPERSNKIAGAFLAFLTILGHYPLGYGRRTADVDRNF